jgi:hypothetical protein
LDRNGRGDIDFKAYMSRFVSLPERSVVLGLFRDHATVSYLKPDFWTPYQQVRAHEFAKFVALAERGKAREPFTLPEAKTSWLSKSIKRTNSNEVCASTVGFWGWESGS